MQHVAAYLYMQSLVLELHALVQLIALSQQCIASFKLNLHTIGRSRRQWQLFTSIYPYIVVSNQFRLQLLTIKLLL